MKSKIIKITCCILAIIVILSIVSAVIFVYRLRQSESYVNFDKSKLQQVFVPITLLDNDGKVLSQPLSLGKNNTISIDTLQPYTYMAFVAIEDKRFFHHDGLDVRRIASATLKNIKTLSYKEGASTITQQLVKNTHLNNQKNFKRKVNEMLLAVEMEKQFSKWEILETYLNTIYFGRSAYGIENASNVYFGKSANQLTVSESAVLAGLIKAPNNYAPDKNLDKCRQRRNVVLHAMAKQNVIDNQTLQQALEEEIIYKPTKNATYTNYSYLALCEACKLLNMTQNQLLQSGFIIETYFDGNVQRQLDSVMQNVIIKNKDGNTPSKSSVICNNKGGVVACYFSDKASLDKRQVGSIIKPIAVYTPAFCQKIITQASPILDEPTNFNGYKPSNTKGYKGWTTIKTSVTKSLNIPAVKTLNALTLPIAQQYLDKLGFSGSQNLSLALGNVDGGMDVFDVAKCYATLANEGKANNVRFVKAIHNEYGTIYKRKLEETTVFDKTSTNLMTDLLIETSKTGTAKKLSNLPYQVACKTGTVGNKQGNTDALAASYTTDYTMVVRLSGDFDNSVNGGTFPCEITKHLLQKIYQNNKPANFDLTFGTKRIAIDKNKLYQSQQIATASDNNSEEFLFDVTNFPLK